MVVVAPVQRGGQQRRRANDAAVIGPHAERVCRALRASVGDRRDAWVTTRVWLDSPSGLVRPDVSVLSGAPPVDGLAEAVDLAVVWDATVPTPVLLDCGAREVWLVGGDTVAVHAARHRPPAPRPGAARPVATRRAGEALTVPGLGVTVTVDDLLLPA